MSHLVVQKSITDTIISIELQLESLGWISVEHQPQGRKVTLTEPRLLWWALEALSRSGFDTENLFSQMQRHPVERHWWFLRQRLPDEALRTLDVKLSTLLLEETA